MGADIAGTAGYQYIHSFPSVEYFSILLYRPGVKTQVCGQNFPLRRSDRACLQKFVSNIFLLAILRPGGYNYDEYLYQQERVRYGT